MSDTEIGKDTKQQVQNIDKRIKKTEQIEEERKIKKVIETGGGKE
jgi:hypothetical protein